MRRLGLIARADDGGLGNLTREFYRHLEPDATLVVDLKGQGRGPVHPEWYPEGMADGHDRADLPVRWSDGWPTDDDVRWLLDRCDVVYSAEVLYHPRFLDLAAGNTPPGDLPPRAVVEWDARRVPVFLHVMPELYDAEVSRAECLLPTSWKADAPRFADAVHLPVPVALDRFERARGRNAARETRLRLLHLASPAMEDRNGTELVAAALRHVHVPAVLTVYGQAEHDGESVRVGEVEVRFRAPRRDYWTCYEGHDVLVQPRRYGGLSLVHQEAAAAGLASVCLWRSPEEEWPASHVHPTGARPVRMKGGLFDVLDANPVEIARVVDMLGDPGSPAVLQAAKADSLGWAEELAWSTWRPRYEDLLRGER